MPTESAPRPFARQLLRAVLGARDATDRDLLARFVRSRDEDAFAELVRRHGRMVLAVGRRVTGHPQDAEDAFQAAFLVLARRAGQVNRPEQLANWLYGVAYRTALEARAARRRVMEHAVSAAPEPAAPDPPDNNPDLRRVIDGELERLPDKYRAAVVLCDLEGVPRADAAQKLKIPEGTLSSRLSYASVRRAINAPRHLVHAGRGRGRSGGEAMGSTRLRARICSTHSPRCREGCVRRDGPARSRFPNRFLNNQWSDENHARTPPTTHARASARLRPYSASGLRPRAQVLAQNTLPEPEVIRNNYPGPPILFRGQYVNQQPKPEKIAQGIEDDDVPLPAMPSQAVIRVEEGKLIVRQRGFSYQPVTYLVGERAVTSYQSKSSVSARTFDLADVSVFDVKGIAFRPRRGRTSSQRRARAGLERWEVAESARTSSSRKTRSSSFSPGTGEAARLTGA